MELLTLPRDEPLTTEKTVFVSEFLLDVADLSQSGTDEYVSFIDGTNTFTASGLDIATDLEYGTQYFLQAYPCNDALFNYRSAEGVNGANESATWTTELESLACTAAPISTSFIYANVPAPVQNAELLSASVTSGFELSWDIPTTDNGSDILRYEVKLELMTGEYEYTQDCELLTTCFVIDQRTPAPLPGFLYKASITAWNVKGSSEVITLENLEITGENAPPFNLTSLVADQYQMSIGFQGPENCCYSPITKFCFYWDEGVEGADMVAAPADGASGDNCLLKADF